MIKKDEMNVEKCNVWMKKNREKFYLNPIGNYPYFIKSILRACTNRSV